VQINGATPDGAEGAAQSGTIAASRKRVSSSTKASWRHFEEVPGARHHHLV